MKIKEAVLKSLKDIGGLAKNFEVYENIIKKGYYDFGNGKTPKSTVSSELGEFIRKGDVRVKRILMPGSVYAYYLTEFEQSLDLNKEISPSTGKKSSAKQTGFEERDLHILLSTYLKKKNIHSKTIFHERSTYAKDSNQIWTHPDMVGIKFLKLQTKASQSFLKVINRSDTFELSSYEIKKEIRNDSELKKAYFQAVSNSSWANYGYLVAFGISDNLMEEMERLNQSFGIGIISLNANPYESKILFQPKLHKLDFTTIDKLCHVNGEFARFIEQSEKLMTAEDRYLAAMTKELHEYCDSYFKSEKEVEDYAKTKHLVRD